MYSHEEVIESSTEYFNGNKLAASTFLKYALRDNEGNILEKTPDEMHRRLAKEFARIEKAKFKNPLLEDEIYKAFDKFERIIPQGSILFAIGNPYQYATSSNCYVLEPPTDSYGGIHLTDEQLSQISKRRGGCGIDISAIRPNGAITKNSSLTSTGIVPFMERYSNSIREVGQNGRRGALMLTIDVHHPQVLDFVKSKYDTTKITGANISVRLTDEFLNAVKKDEDYEQRFPLKKPTFTKKVKAKKVWDEIIKSARDTAEPGLLMWNNILKESPADCYANVGFETVSTNPCSEIPLSKLDSCRLMLLNVFSYIDEPFTKRARLNKEKLKADARLAQRLLDDLIDLELELIDKILTKIENDPEEEYIKKRERDLWLKIKDACRDGRRTGLGPTAIGDSLAALNLKYGSNASIKAVEEIYSTICHGSYEMSVELAKELGPFPVYSYNQEKDCPFIQRLPDEIKEGIKRWGRRNIANLTTAPAGSMSLMAKIGPYFETTSGIEPAFKLEYIRRKKVNHNDQNAKVDFVDQSGDKWTNFKVLHAGLQYWKDITGKTNIEESPYWGACANDLDWNQRVKLQGVAQRYIDHGISSTINLPKDVSYEEVAKIYEAAWQNGLKGVTIYRDGSRSGVLVENKQEGRPRELECDVHHVTVKGTHYFVLVGLNEGKPFEVFAGKNGFLDKEVAKGKIVKTKRAFKAIFDDETELSPITSMCDENQEAITRLVSTSLKHNVDLNYTVTQLEKIHGDMTSFARCVARALKKYIPDGTKLDEKCKECGQDSLVRQEGCVKCLSCGSSKCN